MKYDNFINNKIHIFSEENLSFKGPYRRGLDQIMKESNSYRYRDNLRFKIVKLIIISLVIISLLLINIESNFISVESSSDLSSNEPAEYNDNQNNTIGNHIRTFINWGWSDEFIAQHFDIVVGRNVNVKQYNPNLTNLVYEYFGTMVPGASRQKYQALLDYCSLEGLTSNDLEDMFLHAKEDVYYTLGEPAELDPLVTKLVPGWDPANDLNSDYYISDAEYANRINSNASARYKNESRIPIYFWGPPADYQMNIGNSNYKDFIITYYFPNILSANDCYDGLFLDTLHTYIVTQDETEVLEYPILEQYSLDMMTFLSDLKDYLPSETIIIGNGWYSDPILISGSEYESWAKITTIIDSKKLDTVIEKDDKGIMQLIQYTPIYDPYANPNRPDLYVEGVTLERDQLYSLALYYLIHGNHTYYGYGTHGGYHLDDEKWFDAISYDVGQPIGSYYIFDDSSYYTRLTNNILVNGDFENDTNGDGNPDDWQPSEPVELDPITRFNGNYSSKIESYTEINNINKQYITLEPNTKYTLSARIKTQNLTDYGAQLYPYDFSDLQECDPWIQVRGTTDWTFYSMGFTTGSDVTGRINYRIQFATGTAWFDDFHLTKGEYKKYTVYGRDFQNATVLVRVPFMVDDSTTVSYDLDYTFQKLNANGTLDTPVNTLDIMGGEGVILIRQNESQTQDTIHLEKGWNLISLPTTQNETDITKLLNSINGDYSTVQWYDASDISDPWKHYKIGKNLNNDLTKIDDTMGFWIYITASDGATLVLNRSSYSISRNIPLYKGWNLVGYPSTTNRLRNDALNNLDVSSHISIVEYYNITTGKTEQVGENDYMKQGMGYWIYAKCDCIWQVPL